MLLDGVKPKAEEFDKIVEMLSLTDWLKHLPNQLSGGQKQRVAIGRSLIYRPSIILADEPTGNLDSENTKATLNLLKRANQEYNQTIVMITHDDDCLHKNRQLFKSLDG